MSSELQADSIGSALASKPPHKAEAQELADFFADFRLVAIWYGLIDRICCFYFERWRYVHHPGCVCS